ncbi:MAG TPA: hypothetical protein ENJ95_22960 [Bacteroidetes bacterium]|nr:hypothetical protein [Bacteroidota bacterium]
MKKLIFAFSLVICSAAFFSFTPNEGIETTIIDEEGNVFTYDDGYDCFIHLGEDWAIGDDC